MYYREPDWEDPNVFFKHYLYYLSDSRFNIEDESRYKIDEELKISLKQAAQCIFNVLCKGRPDVLGWMLKQDMSEVKTIYESCQAIVRILESPRYPTVFG